jgi:hypothetical protein
MLFLKSSFVIVQQWIAPFALLFKSFCTATIWVLLCYYCSNHFALLFKPFCIASGVFLHRCWVFLCCYSTTNNSSWLLVWFSWLPLATWVLLHYSSLLMLLFGFPYCYFFCWFGTSPPLIIYKFGNNEIGSTIELFYYVWFSNYACNFVLFCLDVNVYISFILVIYFFNVLNSIYFCY